MFYIAWADAHPVEFWLFFIAVLFATMAFATAAIERGGRNKW